MAEIKVKEMKAPQRREAVRINVPRLDMTVWSAHETMSVAEGAKLINLSATGALFQASHGFPAGAPVQCTFNLTAGGRFSLPCKVVRSMAHDKMTDRFMVAVQFKAPQAVEEALVRWIFRWMAHQHRWAR